MKNTKQKQSSKDGNVPRQVRMPPYLDRWLEEKAAADSLPKTVADKIREIVDEARQAELRQQEEQVA